MHGVVLKRLGHNVHILEQDMSLIRYSEAAGIRAGPQATQLLKEYDLVDQPWSIACPGLKFIKHDSRVRAHVKMPMVMTSWSTLYYRLRANFDGLSSEYCPEPPISQVSDGPVTYDMGKRVTAITSTDNTITVHYESLNDGGAHQLSPDLVIAADGSGSRLRDMVCTVTRPFEGYVAWRGCIKESEISEATNDICCNYTTIFKMKGNYIVV